jgi:tripartite-type tricarboxylate transporter receptor subunit TctC
MIQSRTTDYSGYANALESSTQVERMRAALFQKLALLCPLLFLTASVFAQTAPVKSSAWPKQAIRIVVTFPAGGAPDILARVLAESWQPVLNVPVLIENRPGVGGNIGADLVAKSSPDGYTLLIGTVGIHAINGALYTKMPFDPVADFTPISFLASTPNVLVVNKQLGVTSLRELIALAKSKPNQLTFGSSGIGTSLHMSGELFNEMAGVQIRHIPYKGRAQSIPDLVGGRISMLFDNLSSALPLIQQQEIIALGVTTLKRSPAAPEIPTLAEQGLPNFEAVSWFSLMAPAGLPKELQQQLNRLTIEALSKPEVKQKLLLSGLEPNPGSPRDLSKLITEESNKWSKLIKKVGITID